MAAAGKELTAAQKKKLKKKQKDKEKKAAAKVRVGVRVWMWVAVCVRAWRGFLCVWAVPARIVPHMACMACRSPCVLLLQVRAPLSQL